ncbi:MAG: OprO/OprP family phosphate-selective porin [Pirellulales bacterium]
MPKAPTAEERIAALEKALAKPKAEPPKFPVVNLGGFFHLDSGFFSQDANNVATLGDIQDGVGFRRARLQASGSVAEFTNFNLEMDFAIAGRPSFMDVWGEQTHLPYFGNVRIGQFRQPLCMDALTSVKQLEFLERSLPFQAFVPFRRVGIMAYDKSEDEMWTWAYSGYKTGGFAELPLGDSRFATDIGDVGGYSASTRITHLLHYDEGADGRYLLHVGGGYNYSRITAGGPTGNRYDARVIPEFFVGDPAGGGLTAAGTPFFADTGVLSADAFHLYNVELAGQYGPTHFQAEYMGTAVHQTAGPMVYYDGAYIQAGYFLTGEHRSYNRMFGVFDKITPYTEFFGIGRNKGICGWGAWEIAGRWSYVNLNNSAAMPTFAAATIPPTPNPGRLHDTTLGINWYWNAYASVQFNWIHCFLDNNLTGNSHCDIFATRFQLGF